MLAPDYILDSILEIVNFSNLCRRSLALSEYASSREIRDEISIRCMKWICCMFTKVYNSLCIQKEVIKKGTQLEKSLTILQKALASISEESTIKPKTLEKLLKSIDLTKQQMLHFINLCNTLSCSIKLVNLEKLLQLRQSLEITTLQLNNGSKIRDDKIIQLYHTLSKEINDVKDILKLLPDYKLLTKEFKFLNKSLLIAEQTKLCVLPISGETFSSFLKFYDDFFCVISKLKKVKKEINPIMKNNEIYKNKDFLPRTQLFFINYGLESISELDKNPQH